MRTGMRMAKIALPTQIVLSAVEFRRGTILGVWAGFATTTTSSSERLPVLELALLAKKAKRVLEKMDVILL
jgi:hypothetical protein